MESDRYTVSVNVCTLDLCVMLFDNIFLLSLQVVAPTTRRWAAMGRSPSIWRGYMNTTQTVLHSPSVWRWIRYRRMALDGNQVCRTELNPLCAKVFKGNKNIYLHFMSFLHMDKTQVVEILLHVRQEITYSTLSVSWVLLSWQCKEPGHQQPWYLSCWTELVGPCTLKVKSFISMA